MLFWENSVSLKIGSQWGPPLVTRKLKLAVSQKILFNQPHICIRVKKTTLSLKWNGFSGWSIVMVPEIWNYLAWGKSEHWRKNFGANLNIFVLAARTVRFSGKVCHGIRTHIQPKFYQNSKKKIFKISGANLNKCP